MHLKKLGKVEENELIGVLTRVASIDEVKRRRPDHSFDDFGRYVADTKFILSNLRPKCRVLDIGAGAGIFSIALAQMGFDVTAADLPVEGELRIDFFKRFGCRFVSADLGGHRLPFENAEFEAVLCLHVLEHLKKPREALMELRRVLDKGGVLILMTPNGLITSLYDRLWPIRPVKSSEHVKEYLLNELLSMLKAAGFEVRNVSYSNEMVSSSLVTATALKKFVGHFFLSVCKLFPYTAYEIRLSLAPISALGDNPISLVNSAKNS